MADGVNIRVHRVFLSLALANYETFELNGLRGHLCYNNRYALYCNRERCSGNRIARPRAKRDQLETIGKRSGNSDKLPLRYAHV